MRAAHGILTLGCVSTNSPICVSSVKICTPAPSVSAKKVDDE